MDFTPSQHEAITTHDRSLIVVAGAGSGKTRVLVERYLALLEARPDWPLNALVAITFTRKAAGEMRDRVRLALEARRQAAVREGSEAAARRWSDLLAAMDSARIDTIHGLCTTLLRANAAEAGLDPDFTVMEPVQSQVLLEDAIEAAMSAAGKADAASPLGRLFAHYDPTQMKRVLADAALINADLPDLPDDCMALWLSQWGADCDSACARLLEQSRPHLQWTPLKDGDGLSDKWRECLDRLDDLRRAGDSDERYRVLEQLSGIRKPGKPATKVWGEDGDAAKADLNTIIEAARETCAEIGERPGDHDALAAALLPGWAALVRSVQAAYREAKARQSALDFDDLERLTADLLRDQPEVAARYRGREFRHLLVDEFQDTNASQWQIVQALAGLEVPGSMFVVGDPKQSIYAFRGADVSVFGSVRGQILAARGREVLLSESFRTHAPLVEFFNRVFGELLTRDEHSPVRDYQVERGAPMVAFRQQQPHDGPCVEMILIDPKAAEAAVGEKYNAEHCRRWEAYELAERIHAMVAQGHPVRHRGGDGATRPMHYGDVALLFQSLSNVTLYENVFRARGLPFMTIAGRGYFGKQEVYDLLNLLRALHRPSDDLSLAAALRSPLFALSDDALYALRLTGLPLWDALGAPGDLLPDNEAEAVAVARRCLVYLRGIAGRVTISELLRVALDETGFLATLTGLPDGTQKRGNVEKLFDLAQTSGRVSLGAFQAYLSDLSAREQREGEALIEAEGVVKIMTVHASKGLEFPVVMLADTAWSSGRGGDDTLLYGGEGLACKLNGEDGNIIKPFVYRRLSALASAREDAERRRLLYVAATRAEDYLILSGKVGTDDDAPMGYKADGWLGWLLKAVDPDDEAVLWRCPDQPPPDEALVPAGDAGVNVGRSMWAHPAVEAGQPLPGPAVPPPLLQTISVQRAAQARHLAATSVADLGSAEQSPDGKERRYFRERFKRKVLFDAPGVINRVARPDEMRISSRQIGEIVHEALRWWQPPYDRTPQPERRALLRSYAWAQGITSETDTWDAIERAEGLIDRFMQSRLYSAMIEAQAVYRELPFIHERDGHIVHGVIDLLMRTADGRWILADYKTSYSPEGRTLDALRRHAQRYHLQVGLYAAAVQQQLGTAPAVYIHYVRYGVPVEITAEAWGAALSRSLNLRIESLIEAISAGDESEGREGD